MLTAWLEGMPGTGPMGRMAPVGGAAMGGMVGGPVPGIPGVEGTSIPGRAMDCGGPGKGAEPGIEPGGIP